jgi:hypothetical protein
MVADEMGLTTEQKSLVAGRASFDGPLGRKFVVKHSTWLPWRQRNLWRTFGRRLTTSPLFRLMSPARARTLGLSGDTVSRLVAEDGSGRETHIFADMYVLAAGTVDNFRLLNHDGLRDLPWLGRGFMDHVSGRSLSVPVRDWKLFNSASASLLHERRRFTPRYLSKGNETSGQTTPYAFAHWEVTRSKDHPVSLIRDQARTMQRGGTLSWTGVGRSLQGVSELVSLGGRALLRGRLEHPRGDVYMRVDVEQLPTEGHELGLSDRGDVSLRWGVSRRDEETRERFAALLLDQFPWSDFGCARPSLHFEDLEDTFHMMGGTRMAARSEDGVVDPYGRVHGMGNLYVVGASTFPTGGVANPTLTAGALAKRTVYRMLGGEHGG